MLIGKLRALAAVVSLTLVALFSILHGGTQQRSTDGGVAAKLRIRRNGAYVLALGDSLTVGSFCSKYMACVFTPGCKMPQFIETNYPAHLQNILRSSGFPGAYTVSAGSSSMTFEKALSTAVDTSMPFRCNDLTGLCDERRRAPLSMCFRLGRLGRVDSRAIASAVFAKQFSHFLCRITSA